MSDRTGWQPFLEWAVALALVAFGVITAASIGLFVLPVAAIAVALAARRNALRPDAVLGGLVGVGAVCLFVAYRNRAYSPCPPNGVPTVLRVGEHFSCGGLDPLPWLTAGALLTAAGLLGHAWVRRPHRAAA
jgi:hypothetical protein